MRDVVLAIIIFGAIPFILKRPWIGAMMWVWVSLMNPHRFTWGFAFDMPFAQMIGLATLAGLVFSREARRFPWCGITIALACLSVWMSVTTLFAIHPEWAYPQWQKVMKIQFMNFVILYILHTRQHVEVMAWVVAGSLGLLGIKGGFFTLLGGGGDRVWGPAGSFIQDNNHLALATIVTVPIICYVALQAPKRWIKWGALATAALCSISALGSHSRGALLAIGAMVVFLWVKSKHKLATFAALVLLVPVMIGFMPEHWTERMESIGEYEEDRSVQGRFNSWLMAINLVKDRPLVGGGFDLYSSYTFGRWAPDPLAVHSAHSNYFQMLGEHGYPGLFLFLLVMLLTWRGATEVIRATRGQEQFAWAGDLCRMIQVSLVAYMVGGAFLNLAYFDLPYYLVTLVVLTRVLVQKELGVSRVAVKAGSRIEGIRRAERSENSR